MLQRYKGHSFALGLLVLGMVAVLNVPPTAHAQDRLQSPFIEPVKNPDNREPGAPGDAPVWQEDSRRVRETVDKITPPDRYMESLEQLGVLDMLAGRLDQDPGKALNQWELVGPVGNFPSAQQNGRIAGLQLVPNGSGYRLFAGSCQGGLWSTNTGSLGSWNDIGRNIPNPSVRAFRVDPDNLNHIIVGTGDHGRYGGAGMFQTFNGGATWTMKNLPDGIIPSYFYRIIDCGQDPVTLQARLVAASSDGMFHSPDNGLTWHQSLDNFGNDMTLRWSDVVRHPTLDGRLYAVRCDPEDNSLSGYYYSTDFGETWRKVNASGLPAPEDWTRISLAISPSDPDHLVMLLSTGNALGGIFKTENEGQSWSNITGELISQDYQFGGTQVFHAQAITFHPQDPSFIFVGAVDLATTLDGGATWNIGTTETGINKGHADITQLHFSDETGPLVLWICNDGGIYYHILGTASTYSVIGNSSTGLACSEVDYLAANRLIRGIGLQDNGTLLSYDEGDSWDYITGGDGAEVEIFDNLDGDVFFTNGVYGGTPKWRTFRLLRDSSPVFTNNPDVYMPRIVYSPYTERFFTYDRTSLYSLEENGPLNWAQETGSWADGVYSIRSIWSGLGRDDAVWVTYFTDSRETNEGDEDLTYLFKSGGTWNVQHWEGFNPSDKEIMCVAPSNEWPGEAWVGVRSDAGDAKIFHLRSGGAIKTDITNNLDAVAVVNAIAVTPFDPQTIYVGTDLGVYRTTDGGANWAPFMTGLPIGRCSELLFVEDHTHTGHHTLVLAIDGRGVWQCEIDAPPVLYVDAREPGGGDGSRWHAFNTVAAAVAAAPSEAIIAIHADTYSEPQTINKNLKLVTWQGVSVID